jgi:hypothetical protein
VSDLLALVVVGVAAAAAIVLVATPLLRAGSREERLDAIGEEQRQRLALREERDDALAALRELEFDHRTGKIADEDYRALVAQYRRRVASALEALDVAAGGAAGTGDPAAGDSGDPAAAAEPATAAEPAIAAEPAAAEANGEPPAPPEQDPAPNAPADGTAR